MRRDISEVGYIVTHAILQHYKRSKDKKMSMMGATTIPTQFRSAVSAIRKIIRYAEHIP